MDREKQIKMKFHPRAFSAFGSDLVTNDDVAISELVKNCYDAFANNAAVIFNEDDCGEQNIEIVDDGLGMSQEIIENSWAVIATPYKKEHPSITRNGITRRVSGNKGLGRFSAARLGDKMRIVTKSKGDICFCTELSWKDFENAESIDNCTLSIQDYPQDQLLLYVKHFLNSNSDTGTIIHITNLKKTWTEEEINGLQSSLARLVSPFGQVADFNLYLVEDNDTENIVKVEPQEFIKHPVYSINGTVDSDGSIHWKYYFAPKGQVERSENGTVLWNKARFGFDKAEPSFDDNAVEEYKCGPFEFEIRAWDLDTDSITDIKDTFNVPKREIRQTISKYKGISVYRDKVLVLPKSDSSKDWLGVDIRRVSALGKRLSTSQIVGILSISSQSNPGLKDTTDREKLVDTIEYKQFCKIAETIISALENLRNLDKKTGEKYKERTLVDLLTPLSASGLESNVELMVQQGKDSSEILDVIHEYRENSEKALNELNDRLIYYAQTASLGSIAIIIMHEIRSAMNVIKRFLNRIRPSVRNADSRTEEYYNDAVMSHERLLQVANSFAPLYRRNLASIESSANVREAIENSIHLIRANKEYDNIKIISDVNKTLNAAIHVGELQTIILNLLDNACYWILQKHREGKITVSEKTISETRIEINISDDGPGIKATDAEKIFQPGITSKPQGIGMGLVIVTELLNNHNSKIRTVIPGDLNGATFIFDLPIAKEEKVNQ